MCKNVDYKFNECWIRPTDDDQFGGLDAEGGHFEFGSTVPPASIQRRNVGDLQVEGIGSESQTSPAVVG